MWISLTQTTRDEIDELSAEDRAVLAGELLADLPDHDYLIAAFFMSLPLRQQRNLDDYCGSNPRPGTEDNGGGTYGGTNGTE